MEVACHAKFQRLFTTCLMSKHQQIDLRSLAMEQSTAQKLLASAAVDYKRQPEHALGYDHVSDFICRHHRGDRGCSKKREGFDQTFLPG